MYAKAFKIWHLVILVPILGWAVGVGTASAASRNWQQAEPFKLSPSKNRCIAASNFVRGDRTMLIALEGQPAGQSYEIRFYAPGRLKRWDEGNYSLGTVKVESNRVVVRSGQSGTIYRLAAAKAELDAAGGSPVLKMRGILGPGDITLSGIGAAISLVDSCLSKLLEQWGFSRALQSELVAFPKVKEEWSAYVSSQDYPLEALHSAAGGETRLLIDVDANGKGSNCRIISASGNALLDQTACNIVTERAEYDPGKNANGEAMRAPFSVVFRWEIPSRW